MAGFNFMMTRDSGVLFWATLYSEGNLTRIGSLRMKIRKNWRRECWGRSRQDKTRQVVSCRDEIMGFCL